MSDDFRDPNEKPGRPEYAATDPRNDPGHNLPWPESSDPAQLGERLQHGGSQDDRELARNFERSSEAGQIELGREFADPGFADNRRLANSFADPNSLDDARMGKSFVETNSSAKRSPLKSRVHVPHTPKDPHSREVFRFVLLGFFVVLLLVLAIGIVPRILRNREIDQKASEKKNSTPTVEAETVHRSREDAGLAIPGTTTALTEAFVYARANGYLKTRLVDIGDHVRKNQLLAVIDAPDLDEQVAQARQQVLQAERQLDQQKAQLALATVTVQRYRVLVAKGVFSRQDGDQRETDYAAQQSNVEAAQRNVDAFQANLRRVVALQSYEYVRAPFDGVITQRNVDVGALISAQGSSSGASPTPAPTGQISSSGGSQQAGQSNNAGSSGSTSQSATSQQSPGQGGPLFGIAQLQRLRIFVSVPEGYVTSVHPGGHAPLQFQEYPGADFVGTVTRIANSIDPNTRTMLTEVQIDNSSGKLYPGMYVVATFPPPPSGKGPLLINGDAIMVRNDSTMVAKVVDGKIKLSPVVIGRDYGQLVEIASGVQEGDVIVTNITDDVAEGVPVQVRERKSAENVPPPPPQNLPPGGSTQYGNEGITDRNLQGQQAKQNNKGSGGAEKAKSKPSNSESKQ
ncbi:MAG TPA: efflux RND transporter periplasmic adaptor subunit [Acidobacteriaceae bacterium]|jgi:multidrug efflux pump subunit AcrA (membrane-fusion protein)